MKTNLFIVGAAKCGTTSFHEYLSQHPDINMSLIKETNFFSNEQLKNDNLYYSGINICENTNDYLNCFSPNSNAEIQGESSVSYLYYSNSAKRIYNYNSNAKILIFLRNPVDRAISHYLMDFNAGYFPYKIEEIFMQREKYPKQFQQVFELGNYFNQIQEYYNVFPKKNIKIIIMEKEFHDLKKVMKEVEDFLEIKNYASYNFTIKNFSLTPKNLFVKLFYKNLFLKNFSKKIFSKKMIKILKNIFLSRDKQKISKKTTNLIVDFYQHEINLINTLVNFNVKKFWN